MLSFLTEMLSNVNLLSVCLLLLALLALSLIPGADAAFASGPASTGSKPSSTACAVGVERTDQGADEQCSVDEDDAVDCFSSEGFDEEVEEYATISKVLVAKVESLRGRFESFEKDGEEGSNKIHFNQYKQQGHSRGYSLGHLAEDSGINGDSKPKKERTMEYNQLISDKEYVLVDTVREPGMQSVSRAFYRGGPRKLLHFNPKTVNAAIVTCGGLCPGLNNVVRELVRSLHNLYGANQVWGVTGGFNGFHNPDYQPILLTNEVVENIHHEGGSALTTSRGGLDIDKTLEFLQARNISHLYIIGGDGTHRGAYAIHEACMARKLNVAVAGIPKTIDNDIDYIDRSFGFLTAVEAAQASIRTAKVEASCTRPNGVGIIKLMGRSAGFLAAVAALGSGDVDAVLVPEVPIVLDGPKGILPFIRKRVKEQKYAVVVVAEGAGEDLVGSSTEKDAGGNKLLMPIAEFIRDKVKEHFKEHGERCSMKYIDPSYNVRSVPANAADSLYCAQLAQNAVHGTMAGFTGFSVGLINNRVVYLPIPKLVATSPRQMNPYGAIWERVLAMTGQPNTAPPRGVVENEFPELPEPSIP